jgi:hypothetical protein
MIPLKYQTSGQDFILGKFISTDGNTVASSSLTIANTDVILLKHGSTSVATKSTSGLTFTGSTGYFGGTFSSDDTDTLGDMRIYCHVAGALVVKEFARVMTENEYNTFIANTDYLDVNTISVSSGAISSQTMSSGAISTNTLSTGAWDVGAHSVWAESTKVLTAFSTGLWSTAFHSTAFFSTNFWSTAFYSTTISNNVSTAVWANSARTLTAFSTGLFSTAISDNISTAVWNYATRTLSAFSTSLWSTAFYSTTISDNVSTAVWNYTTRILTNMSSVTLSAAAYSTLVDMIWDEARSGHVSTLSVGFTQSTLNWSYQSSVMWDEVLTAATHNIATSAARRIREMAGISIYAGTATAGTANSITLDAGASATNNLYNENLIALINGGTGSGQVRLIAEYDGTTKVAIVDREWDIIPDATSEFQIIGFSGILLTGHGAASAGTADTITLSTASLTTNDAYKGSMLVITSGTGAGQARLITGYTAATYVANVSPDWTTNPDNTSVYKIIPVGRSIADSMSTTATDEIFTSLVESTITVKDALMIMLAEAAGASTGGGTSTTLFYSPNSTTARITATTSSLGNRSSMTFDLT